MTLTRYGVSECRSPLLVAQWASRASSYPAHTSYPTWLCSCPTKFIRSRKSRKGVPWHPSERRVNFSPVMKAGPWRYFAGQIPSVDFNSVYQPPPGLPYHHSSIEEQAEVTFNLLSKELTENETDWDHCYQVRFFLIEPKRDYRGFARSWSKLFPDPSKAPALAYVPSTKMMIDGPLIEIDRKLRGFLVKAVHLISHLARARGVAVMMAPAAGASLSLARSDMRRAERHRPAPGVVDLRRGMSMSSSLSRFSGWRSRSLSLGEGLTDSTGARDGTRADGVLDRGRRRKHSF